MRKQTPLLPSQWKSSEKFMKLEEDFSVENFPNIYEITLFCMQKNYFSFLFPFQKNNCSSQNRVYTNIKIFFFYPYLCIVYGLIRSVVQGKHCHIYLFTLLTITTNIVFGKHVPYSKLNRLINVGILGNYALNCIIKGVNFSHWMFIGFVTMEDFQMFLSLKTK